MSLSYYNVISQTKFDKKKKELLTYNHLDKVVDLSQKVLFLASLISSWHGVSGSASVCLGLSREKMAKSVLRQAFS